MHNFPSEAWCHSAARINSCVLGPNSKPISDIRSSRCSSPASALARSTAARVRVEEAA